MDSQSDESEILSCPLGKKGLHIQVFGVVFKEEANISITLVIGKFCDHRSFSEAQVQDWVNSHWYERKGITIWKKDPYFVLRFEVVEDVDELKI